MLRFSLLCTCYIRPPQLDGCFAPRRQPPAAARRPAVLWRRSLRVTLGLLYTLKSLVAMLPRKLSEQPLSVSHRGSRTGQRDAASYGDQLSKALPLGVQRREWLFEKEPVAEGVLVGHAQHLASLQRHYCRDEVEPLHPTLLRKVDKPRYASAATSLCRRLRQSTPSTPRVVSTPCTRDSAARRLHRGFSEYIYGAAHSL